MKLRWRENPRRSWCSGWRMPRQSWFRRAPSGQRLHVRPAFDGAVTKEVKRFFDECATVSFENYAVDELRDAPQATGAR